MKWCPVSAIVIGPDRVAVVDYEICYGCGECVASCPYGAIGVQWKTTPEALQEKIVEHVAGALAGKEGKIVYLSFVTNVSPDCDCWNFSDAPVVADIGVLASTDIVAIDQAAYDLVVAATGFPADAARAWAAVPTSSRTSPASTAPSRCATPRRWVSARETTSSGSSTSRRSERERVEYGRILRGAWSITARTRALWWLGAIAAAQVAISAVVVAGLGVPLALMPGFASTIASIEAGASSELDSARALPFFTAAAWLGAHLGTVAIGAVAVFSVWLVLGVFDVVAQIGIVTQANAVAERDPASLATGLRDGFRLWWRAVALLALAALPTLAYLLLMALMVLFTVTLPLYLGQPPHAGAALVSNLVLAPLSGIASLVSVPLAVLIQLAMRFAVIDDSAWRPSFGAAWRLAKANLAEIAVTYVLLLLVALLAVIACAVLVAAAAAIIGVLLLGVALIATAGDTVAAGRAALWGAAGSAALLLLAFQAVMFVWQSSVWTLVWRDRTGRGPGSDIGTHVRGTPGGTAASTMEGKL